MTEIVPEAQQALAHIDGPDYIHLHVSHVCEAFLNGFRFTEYVPDARMFHEPSSGMAIVLRLLDGGDREDGFPAQGILTRSQSELAREFAVSRVHVRRLLNEAVREGFLERARSESFMATPRLTNMVCDWMAVYFLLVLHGVRAALAGIKARQDAANAGFVGH